MYLVGTLDTQVERTQIKVVIANRKNKPPYFTEELRNITVSLNSEYTYTLPDIVDDEGDQYEL